MSPKSYTPIFASHRSTCSPSGLSKDKLALYVVESVCHKDIIVTVNQPAAAMVHGESCGLFIDLQ